MAKVQTVINGENYDEHACLMSGRCLHPKLCLDIIGQPGLIQASDWSNTD